MTRTVSYVAAFSFAVLGTVVATAATSPSAALGSLSPSLGLVSQVTEQGPLDQRRLSASVQSAQSASTGTSLAVRTLDAPLGTRARTVEPSARPQVRTFVAKGPLVARVSDGAFGPKVRPDDLLIPDPPPTLAGASDLLCMAVATYHEARNQPLDGQLAVASVILNRTRAPERWGASPCEVVTPVQFSFLSSDGRYPVIDDGEAWAIAVEIAREALERGPSPAIGEADHYHTTAVQPVWNKSMEQVVRIDDHVFFVDPTTQG